MNAPAIDGPDSSPDLLARPPSRGRGVRRLNRLPLFIAIGLGLTVLLLLVYTASTRGQRANSGASDTKGNTGAVTSSTPPELADEQSSGVIAPAIVGPTIDPTTGATIGTGAPVTQQVVVRQRPPNPYEQDWARYQQQRVQLAQAREERYLSALNAPSGVQFTSSQTGAAGSAGAGLDGAGLASAGGTSPAASGAATAAAGQDNDAEFNGQGSKRDFLRAKAAESNYSPAMRTAVVSPYEMKAGTVIPAVMIGGINSDLPGQIIAQVSENVFDTKTGRHLLIPQGSRLVGTYDNSVTMGQSRVLVAWNRVIFPDASSLDLNMMPGADQGGYAGFHDRVNNHYGKVFGSALMLSLFSAGIQVSQPQARGFDNESYGQTIGGAVGQQLGNAGQQIMQRNLRIQPTLQIRPGYRFNVSVTKDMIVEPWRR